MITLGCLSDADCEDVKLILHGFYCNTGQYWRCISIQPSGPVYGSPCHGECLGCELPHTCGFWTILYSHVPQHSWSMMCYFVLSLSWVTLIHAVLRTICTNKFVNASFDILFWWVKSYCSAYCSAGILIASTVIIIYTYIYIYGYFPVKSFLQCFRVFRIFRVSRVLGFVGF